MIKPLGSEINAVVTVLRSEAFEDEHAMAREIVRTVADELGKRTSWAVAFEALAWGPFAYPADAVRFAATLPGDCRLIRLGSPVVRELITAAPPCVCGHAKDMHTDRGRCAVYSRNGTGPKARIKPHLPQCGCTHYEKGK